MILSAAEKKNRAIRKRRKIAIIASAILIAVLAVALVFILDYVRTYTFVDRIDGTEYFIRYRDGAYALYDTDKKTKLPIESQYGYYVTHSGTLVGIDAATGEVTRTWYVDTSHLVGTEALGNNDSIMIFPHVEADNIRSIQIVNDNGKHTYEFARYNSDFKRDDSGEFAITGSPLTEFDLELFSSLRVACGYTVTLQKIADPIKDANGAFSEYGLVPERRVDDEGNEYDYVPTYYILTETSGTRHKVIIGDRLVTGGGYYAQYVKLDGATEIPFDAVYVFDTYVADSILLPIEDYVTPKLTYQMSANNFHDVQQFKLVKKNNGTGDYDELVAFSFVDMAERENTSKRTVAYRFDEGTSPATNLAGFDPASDSISTCLGNVYEPIFEGIHAFNISNEMLVETGLYRAVLDENGEPKYTDGVLECEMDPDYIMTFFYSPLDDNDNKLTPVKNIVMFSGPNEDGNYYAFTQIYTQNGRGEYEFAYDMNMIVELDGVSMDFLAWDSFDWVDPTYLNLDIVYCESIRIETSEYWANFVLDNSLSTEHSSDGLSVIATDRLGNTAKTFGKFEVTDKYGVTWTITQTSIKLKNNPYDYTTIHYENNRFGDQVQVDTVGIECVNGDKIIIEADYIVTYHVNGTVSRELRYQTDLFRSLFRTFTYASIRDSYPLTEEERAEKLADDKLIMTFTIVMDGETYTYRFYELTGRKALMTLNGNGEFCVNTQRLDKFVSDCQRFFALEPIDDTGKV